MSVLWRPQIFCFFELPHLLLFTEPKCSTQSFHHENTTSFRGSRAPLTLVVTLHRWRDRKQGHPETATSSLRTFCTIARVVMKELGHSDSYHHNNNVFFNYLDASLHRGEPVEFLQVVLVYLQWKDARKRRRHEAGLDTKSEVCPLWLDQIQSSLCNDGSKLCSFNVAF